MEGAMIVVQLLSLILWQSNLLELWLFVQLILLTVTGGIWEIRAPKKWSRSHALSKWSPLRVFVVGTVKSAADGLAHGTFGAGAIVATAKAASAYSVPFLMSTTGTVVSGTGTLHTGMRCFVHVVNGSLLSIATMSEITHKFSHRRYCSVLHLKFPFTVETNDLFGYHAEIIPSLWLQIEDNQTVVFDY